MAGCSPDFDMLANGITLFREEDGYVVRLRPDDHKTGSKTGKDREFALPQPS
jgi:hypothetical protein